MNIREHTNLLLQKIAEELPPEAFADHSPELDNNDEFSLTLDDKITFLFYLEEDSRSLILNLPLAKLPDSPSRETIMLELLRANYCWNLTEGGTLGVDSETSVICLSYLVPLPLEVPEQMPQIISKLAAVAQHCQRTLEEMNVDEESDTPAFDMLRA